jgi:cell division transport system permease protein
MRRALSDRLLPLIVGAMVFLAALASAGALAAASLADRWNTGAAAIITITVSSPEALQNGMSRAQSVASVLAASPGISSARRLPEQEIKALLEPWLGADPAALALNLPAIFELHATPGLSTSALEARLAQEAPGTVIQRNGEWISRLAALARSLQACAALAVAAATVGVATRAGLAARRDAIEIVHGLGATDHMIASQFAHRITMLVLAGAVVGLGLVVPLLFGLAALAEPFTVPGPRAVDAVGLVQLLPPLLWGLLMALPVVTASVAVGILFASLAWCAGFAWFVQDSLRPAPLPATADGIVALTGGADRIATALQMLQQNRARLLLISGVGPTTEFSALFRGTGIDPASLSGRITVGRAATDTLGNADEAADWARAHALHSLIVVTASYHMKRAITEIQRALPDTPLFAAPVLPPALRGTAGLSTLRLLAGEYTKFLAAELGVTRIQRAQIQQSYESNQRDAE